MDIRDYLDSLNMRLGRRAKVGFIGVGVSNLALLEGLNGCGYDITVRQMSRASVPSPQTIKEIYGDAYLSDITEDVLFLSPSVRRDKPELLSAAARGVIISSDMDLFFMSQPDVYAVTGSDGKSTTATLARALLSERISVDLIGNIGAPFSMGVGDRFVAELSSFQLMYHSYPVRAAIITSLSENHLDWHKSKEEYYGAKLALIDRAQHSVLSYDSPMLAEYLKGRSVTVIYSIKEDYTSLSSLADAEHYITLSRAQGENSCQRDEVYIAIDGEAIIPVSHLGRKEWYNVSNLMGAMGLCMGEYSLDRLFTVAKNFNGLGDRCEHIDTIGDVEYINSSIDTSPMRTAATLSALGRQVSLIAGGRGKGLQLSPAIPYIQKYAKRITLYGEAGKEFLEPLIPLGIPIEYCERFDDAFHLASEMSEPGDTVLLSPMATGYGEFKSYRERAERFCELVTSLRKL